MEMRSRFEGVSTAQPSPKLAGTVRECDDALGALVTEEPAKMKSMLKGLQRANVTWEQRAAGAFLYLQPNIYGNKSCSRSWRLTMVAAALGVDERSLEGWFSLQNNRSKEYTSKWLSLVKGMTWKDVSAFFKPCWIEQWGLDASETVKDQLGVYEDFIKGSKMSFLSKYTLSTTTAGRKSAASNDKALHVIKTASKRVRRADAGKPHKYIEQETFVINLVEERWNQGDPLGKIELKDEVMSRDDCLDGTDFYKQYLDPTKLSAASGWTNWVSRVLT